MIPTKKSINNPRDHHVVCAPPKKSLLPCDGSSVKKIINFKEIQDTGWMIVMSGYVDAREISTATRGRYVEGPYKQTHRKFSSIYWGLLLVFLVYLVICCFLG